MKTALTVLLSALSLWAPSAGAQQVSKYSVAERSARTPPERPPAVPWRRGEGPASVDRPSREHVRGPLRDVRLARGEFVHQERDLRVRGRGFDFEWVRTYRSRQQPHGRQGVGWTHSYDLRVRRRPGFLVLRDGQGRADRFDERRDGTYTRDGFFVQGRIESDGSIVFEFPDESQWRFRSAGGSVSEYRVSAIVDRAGNRMAFAYDGEGRLSTITDTLGRPITVAYGPGGNISSVTDFAGRSVRYTYYGPGDAGGSEGDLRSVTSPAVVDTPTGNDFPDGKTRIYTYSRGKADARLDHNLLQIRNADGTTFLRNRYAATTDDGAVEFDRVVAQTWNEGVERTVTYSESSSGVKATTNDGRGVVREFNFDGNNQLWLESEYTGFAEPGLPVTADQNRPSGQVRSTDPSAYVTRYSYNERLQLISILLPDGNATEFVHAYDLDKATPLLISGNLLEIHRTPGLRGATQEELVTVFEYSEEHNLPTRVVYPGGAEITVVRDGEGNPLTVFGPVPGARHDREFNAHGQLTAHVWPADGSGFRRRDELSYHSSGPQAGYLAAVTTDAAPGGLGLVESFEWDSVGNPTRRVDANGNDTILVWSADGLPLQVKSPEMSQAGGMRYLRNLIYDEANHLVRVDVQNVDETGAVEPNEFLSTARAWGPHGELLSLTREVDESTSGTVEYQYDAEGNRILTLLNAALTGEKPGAVNRVIVDERNLPFLVVRGEGSDAQSTTELSYDGSRNVVQVRTGLEDGARTTTQVFDGFERKVSTTDAMGNELCIAYDADSHPVRHEVFGELEDVPGADQNVLLERVHHMFDALGLETMVSIERFDPETGSQIGAGVTSCQRVWDAMGSLVSVTSPRGFTTSVEYDRAHRVAHVIDAAGTEYTYAYDDVGNLIGATELDHPDSAPDQSHTWSFEYDERNQQVARTDPGGGRFVLLPGSVGRVRRTIDERGNAVRCEYDGLGRMTSRSEEIRAGGTGSGLLLGERTTLWEHDFDFGMRSVTDDNGHVTGFEHDELGRIFRTNFADGTSEQTVWDAHGDAVVFTDRNQSVLTRTFDDLGRETFLSIVPGPGVSSATISQARVWDGRGLLVGASDEDTLISRKYDSAESLLLEIQAVTSSSGVHAAWVEIEGDPDSGLPATVTTIGRDLTLQRDGLERVTSATMASGEGFTQHWIGPNRIDRIEYWNGAVEDYTYDAALNPVDVAVARPGNGLLLERTASWDEAGRLTERADFFTFGSDFTFVSNSLFLTRSIEVPQGGGLLAIDLEHDGVGNRLVVTGGPEAGSYELDPTFPVPADAQVNQYTATPFDTRIYDRRGNLVSRDPNGAEAEDTFAYDAFGNLVQRTDGATGEVFGAVFDPLGRRLLVRHGSSERQRVFLGDVVFAEADPDGGNPIHWISGDFNGDGRMAGLLGGDGLDFLIWSRGPRSPCPGPRITVESGSSVALHRGPEGNVIGLSDASGTLVEQYDYDTFGKPRFGDGSGHPITGSALGNPYLFGGLRLEGDGLYLSDRSGVAIDYSVGRPINPSVLSGPGGRHGEPTDWEDRVRSAGAGLDVLIDPGIPSSAPPMVGDLAPGYGIDLVDYTDVYNDGLASAVGGLIPTIVFAGQGGQWEDTVELVPELLPETTNAIDTLIAEAIEYAGDQTPWGDYDDDGIRNRDDLDDDNDGVPDDEDDYPKDASRSKKEKKPKKKKGEEEDEDSCVPPIWWFELLDEGRSESFENILDQAEQMLDRQVLVRDLARRLWRSSGTGRYTYLGSVGASFGAELQLRLQEQPVGATNLSLWPVDRGM